MNVYGAPLSRIRPRFLLWAARRAGSWHGMCLLFIFGKNMINLRKFMGEDSVAHPGDKPRDGLSGEENTFLVEWLVQNNKELARKNRELLVENARLGSRVEALEKISYVDFATGIHNREYLHERLGEEFSRARRTGSPLSCLFMDMDDFKRVNDAHGHLAGDRLLKDMAQLLKSFCRREDVLVRFGGDEFVLLMSCTGRRKAKIVAERILRRIAAQVFDYGEFKVSMTLSIGISTLRKGDLREAGEADGLIWTADRAMYEAKKGGKNGARHLDGSSRGTGAPRPLEAAAH